MLLLLACAPAPSSVSVPERTTEVVGDQTLDPSDMVFDGRVHEVVITLPAASRDALSTDPYSYAPGSVTFDGEPFPSVAVRLRGKLGSFRTLDRKPKFRVDFNATIADQTLFGLESLTLNNEVVDCGYLKEPLGYKIFRDAGVAAPRTGWASVTVDGLPYGLYVIIETPDDEFVGRHYAPDGNLYDGKYNFNPDDWSYQLLDFASGVDDAFTLEEGTDVGNADIKAVSDAILSARSFEADTPQLAWDEIHTMLAVEQVVGHNDGYALNTNNYRVYFDPTDGRANLVPYDLDYGFLHDADWWMDWNNPRGRIAAGCWADADCRERQRDAVAEVLDGLDVDGLHAFLDAQDALTLDYASEDPRRECGMDYVAWYRQSLHDWLDTEPDAIRARWSL